jgi:hypothetical protein
MKRLTDLRFRGSASAIAAIGAAGATFNALAHPGHEPESLLHALAHEIASPRGVLALILIAVAAGLWLHKRNHKK